VYFGHLNYRFYYNIDQSTSISNNLRRNVRETKLRRASSQCYLFGIIALTRPYNQLILRQFLYNELKNRVSGHFLLLHLELEDV